MAELNADGRPGALPARGDPMGMATTPADGPLTTDPAATTAEPAMGVAPGTRRVDVRASMAVEAGPWRIAPNDPRLAAIQTFGDGRATIEPPLAPDGEAIHAVLGLSAGADRSGRQRREIVVGGWRVVLDVEDERLAGLRDRATRGREDAAHDGPLEVRAIIPGRVVAVSVAEGDTVEPGQQLLVIEAMKMQNELRSPRAGVVERIAAGVGETVDLGAVLLVLR